MCAARQAGEREEKHSEYHRPYSTGVARHVTTVLALNAYFNASRGQLRSCLRAILVIQATFLPLPCRPVTDMLTRRPSVVDLAGCPAMAAVIPVPIMSVVGPAVVVSVVLDISTATSAAD